MESAAISRVGGLCVGDTVLEIDWVWDGNWCSNGGNECGGDLCRVIGELTYMCDG